MAMTITEKIMAKSAGRAKVAPGETVWLAVDVLMTHDVCGPPTIEIWRSKFGENAKIWDKNKLVIFPDHYIFTQDKHARRNVEILRNFAREQNLPNYFDVGTERYRGVCHVALAEEGFNKPGAVLIGTDSHSCTAGAFGMFATGVGNTDAAFILGSGKIWEKVPESLKIIFDGEMPEYLSAKDLILQLLGDLTTNGATYCALEFVGEAVRAMNMYERMTLTNMAIEAGAVNGIIQADETTLAFLADKIESDFEIFASDENAHYREEHFYQVDELEPVVAQPHSPDNVESVRKLQGEKITKSYIGSCTGGKIYDFQLAAKILFGNEVKVPTFIVPATTTVQRDLQKLKYRGISLWEIFEKAGCTIAPPSCAACLGGPQDTVGRAVDGDVIVSTTNRNFPGRMGNKNSDVYLASPLTAAASAVKGELCDPREFLNK